MMCVVVTPRTVSTPYDIILYDHEYASLSTRCVQEYALHEHRAVTAFSRNAGQQIITVVAEPPAITRDLKV